MAKRLPKRAARVIPEGQLLLYDILSEVSGLAVSEITEDSLLDADLHCDSLDVVEIVMELEERYKVAIDEDLHGDTLEEGTVKGLLKTLKAVGANV